MCSLTTTTIQTLERYGDEPIHSLVILKEPVEMWLMYLLNVFTCNQVRRWMTRLNIPRVYHTALWINRRFVLDRFLSIRCLPRSPHPESIEMEISHLSSITLKEIMSKVYSKEWYFDLIDENCHTFTQYLLTQNELSSPEIEVFIREREREVYTVLPFWFQEYFRYGANVLIYITNTLKKLGIDMDF